MISPLLLLQAESITFPWQLAIGAALVLLTGVTTWFFSRPKTRTEIEKNAADTKKSEVDTILGVAREFPLLLNQIAVAQRKSLDDEKTIYQKENKIDELEKELQNCLAGGPCAELKVTILAIMADVEPMIQAIERTDLLERFNQMKEKLV
jgi:hypothetical protein